MPTQRVKDDDDPRRCMGEVEGGQCRNISEEDSDYCSACGVNPDERDAARDYLAEQFKRRIKLECGEGEEVILLKENLMNINMMLAAYRNKIKDDASLALMTAPIMDLAMKAEKITNTLHRLSLTHGLLLGRPALIRWGDQIIQAVAEVVEDKYDGWEDDLVELSYRISQIIVLTKNEEGETPK